MCKIYDSVVGMCLHCLWLHTAFCFVCLEDEFVAIKLCWVDRGEAGVRAICAVGSRFPTAGSLIYLQMEKRWEMLELLTQSESLYMTLYLHFSLSSLRCHFCTLMPRIFPEVLVLVELSQSHNCKKMCSRYSIQKGQRNPKNLFHLAQHSVNYRIVLKILLTIFVIYSKIPKAVIIMK